MRRLEKPVKATSQSTYRVVGDPTEGAILVAAAKAGVAVDQDQRAYPRTDEIPFDSIRKRMVTCIEPDARDEDISPIYGEIRAKVCDCGQGRPG